MTHRVMESPVGRLKLTEEDGYLTGILFLDEGEDIRSTKSTESDSPLLLEAEKELKEYFEGKRKEFDLERIPLRLDGTDFQKKVWISLMTIPYGTTISYKDLAEMVDSPKAVRACGSANGKNPLPIIIPCHRVINSSGELGGYSSGIHNKKILLNLEKNTD